MDLGNVVSADAAGWRLAVALGIGLIIGLERERRKGTGPQRAPAGIRTFALTALLGGIAMQIGSPAVLVVSLAFVGVAALAAYALGDRTDPGLTTEVALLATFLLGALAQREPGLAAGLGVSVAILLASRGPLQRLVSQALTEQELHDALLLGAAALVILPLVPDRAVGPFDAFNPFTIWRLVVLVMAISAAVYIAVRVLGPRIGLPLSGLASGFVSSTATIGAMGTRVRNQPEILRPAVAAGVLSTVATVAQMALVVGATDENTLRQAGTALALAGGAAVLYGIAFGVRALQSDPDVARPEGRAFEPRVALLFAGTVAAMLFASAALEEWLGDAGVAVAAGASGFADAHAAAISVTSLVVGGKLEAADAVMPILIGFSTNSLTKAVVAWVSGGPRFALDIWPGLALVLMAGWAGWAFASLNWF